MENENRCFFSVSLENGITITGEDPYQVRDFLRHIWNGIASELLDPQEEQMMYPNWYSGQRDLAKRINSAISTINQHMKGAKK